MIRNYIKLEYARLLVKLIEKHTMDPKCNQLMVLLLNFAEDHYKLVTKIEKEKSRYKVDTKR